MVNTNDKEKIFEYIESADVVSFDIFDTLITRITGRPEDVFDVIAHYKNITDFSKIRTEGQHNASLKIEREKGYPHADLDEIYDYIKQNSKLDDVVLLKKIETEAEKDSICCNMEIMEFYQYAKSLNKRVIATSDMYLSSNTIMDILHKCGYHGIDKLYVSSETKSVKYNDGSMFNSVIKSEKVEPQRIFHIGDNYDADYLSATKKGIKAIHYKCQNQNEQNEKLELSSKIDKGIVRTVLKNNNNANFWFKLGVKVGGSLYSGLFLWMLDNIKNEFCDQIYFLSRDGYILYELFKKFNIPNIKYLHTSRRALMLAGIVELDKESLNILPPFTFGQTVDEILKYICLDEITDKAIIDVGFNNRQDIIKNLSDFQKMKQLYLDNAEIVLKVCDSERKNAKEYFNKLELLNSKSIIFDCGWNGSSQYLLDRALSTMGYSGKNKFYYTGIMNSEKAKHQLNNKNLNTYLFGFNYNVDIQNKLFRAIAICEMFFGAPHASVWKYENGVPVFDTTEKEHEYKNEIGQGIHAYIESSIGYCQKYNIRFTPVSASKNLGNLIFNPTFEEAEFIGNISNVDAFATKKGQDKFLAKLSLREYINNPKTEIYWPEGLLKRKDINPILKAIVAREYNINNHKNKHFILGKGNILLRGMKVLSAQGILTFLYLLKNKFSNNSNKQYQEWIKINEQDIYKKREISYKPMFSVVVPVYNVLSDQLSSCIDSVLKQTYDNWELILVDDASTWENVRKVLRKYENNKKINIIYRKENGHISRTTNDGIKVSKGEFIAFLDCDDTLAPNALYEMAIKLNENKDYDFIYSDEDKLTADGKKRHSPFFKPDWSPDTFMSLMYTCHFSVYRKSLVDEIGGLTVGLDGAQDYDFTLRFSEKAKLIGHIPKLLYHWRERAESIASNPESKPYALEAVRKLKEEALRRRGHDGKIEYVKDMYQYRVTYINKENPLASIIIPSKDNPEILKNCLSSIKELSTYSNYELVVIDNGSELNNKLVYEAICNEFNAIYYYEKMDFNFSAMCNKGAELAQGSVLVFLNDDIEIITKSWIDTLVGHASLDHVGAVGAKLLYPESNIIQHSGIINLPIGPSHSFIGFDDRSVYYYGRNRMDYNFIAVTAACLAIEKRKFNEIKGFDEKLTVGYNDVDLCFGLIEHGYYNVVRNDVKLYHYESLSRGSDDTNSEKAQRLLSEREILYQKHPNFLKNDPFYNKNLVPNKVNYELSSIDNLNYNSCVKTQNISLTNISDRCKVFIDTISNSANVEIEGWAYLENAKFNNFNKVYVFLQGENDNSYMIDTIKVFRPDVSAAFSKNGKLNFTGFKCKCDKSQLSSGNYNAIIVTKNLLDKAYCTVTHKSITINI